MSADSNAAPEVVPARVERAENAAQAYQRVEPEILALPAERVGRITADVSHAASVALGAVKNLQQLRPEFERLGDGGAALRALGALEDYAFAAVFAHLQTLPEATTKELSALVERARPLRENLLKVAESLASFGVFSDKAVSVIREGTGQIDMAQDLMLLGTLFDANWEAVQNKVPFQRELVAEASRLGAQVLRAIGSREVGEVRRDPNLEWSGLKTRAFRLMIDAYEEVRRATNYVRWYQGDARTFAPSLHQRTARRPTDAADDAADSASEPGGNNTASAAAAAPPVVGAASGLPGDHPFSS
jgi:hypothetical protein